MENIDDILAKHFSGEATPSEEQQVQDWKKSHAEAYALMERMWNEPVDLSHKTYDSAAALQKISGRLDERNNKEANVFTLKRFNRFAIAASIAILLGLTATWYFLKTDFIRVTNDADTAKEINLEDGSTIWLAANSTLEYAEDFKSNRDLKLTGEAYFEVAKDPEHPFKIATETGEVEVLGTAFNVISSTEYTEVSVTNGRVALRNKKEEIKLTAGQSAKATKTEISEVTANKPNYSSWMNGTFTFDQTPLTDVIEQLNSYYEKEIVLENKTAGTTPITASFTNQSAEEAAEILALITGLETTFSDHQIVLK